SDRALGRLRDRRDDRPAGDVSERRVRGSGESCGIAGDECAWRAGRAGTTAWAASDRQRARRADGPERQPRDRGTGGVHRAAGEMVVEMADAAAPFRIKGETGEWEVVVGLEVHAQITASKAKLFSGAATAFGAEPNTQVSLVDAAMPGMLPVPNKECIRQAVRTGMALDAVINRWSRFDRKNYFYADLPQGYQISQLYHPLVGEGEVEVLLDEKDETSAKRIGIGRIHVEQDAG